MMPLPAEIAPIVQECFNRRDGARLLSLWTDDFRYEGPNLAFIGKHRMLAQEQNLWTAFPDMRCEVSPFVTATDRAVLATRMVGTHAGPLRLGGTSTVAPTGRQVDFTLSVHMYFRDGLIAGERIFYDTAGFMRQLGLLDA
jgi:predicted ester cyclase